MSQGRERAAREIEEKRLVLRSQGLDLGAATDRLQEIGWNGWCQSYEHGRIYWHPERGAQSVHEGIIDKYLSLEETERGDASGRQEPDGLPVDDTHCTVSRFEEDHLCWLHGENCLYGAFYEAWEAMGGEKGVLGYPVADPFNVGPLEVAFFEGGCLVSGTGLEAPVIGRFNAPPIGAPAIVQPGEALPVDLTFTLKQTVWAALGQHADTLAGLWKGRLALYPAGRSAQAIPLMITVEQIAGNATGAWAAGDTGYLKISCSIALAEGAALSNRTLYDISLHLPNGRRHTIAPHALYVRKEWNDFASVATDQAVGRLRNANAPSRPGASGMGATRFALRFVGRREGIAA